MFEVGWSEMLVIAIVMIVVVGPKDLPNMLRTMGRMAAKLRGMAGDFQRQFNEALKEAELEDVKKSVDSLRGLNPMAEIRKQLNPFEQAAADVRSGLDQAVKPKPADPAAPAAVTDAAQPPASDTPLAASAAPETPPAETSPAASAVPETPPAANVAPAPPPATSAAQPPAAPAAASAPAKPASAAKAAAAKPAAAKRAPRAAPEKPASAAPEKPASAKRAKAPAAGTGGKRTAK